MQQRCNTEDTRPSSFSTVQPGRDADRQRGRRYGSCPHGSAGRHSDSYASQGKPASKQYTGQPSIRDRPFTRFPALPFRTRALRQGRGVPPRCHAGSIASQFRVIIRALLFRTRALSSCLFPQPMSRVQPKSWILALTKLQVLPVPRVDVASQGVDVSLERVRLHQGYRFLFRV